MKTLLCYVFYRLYKCVDDTEIPFLIAILWIEATILLHALTVLGLLSIKLDEDLLGRVSGLPKHMTITWLIVGCIPIYILIKVFKVDEIAFSEAMLGQYKKKKYKGLWLIVYYVVSFFVAIVSAWFCGEHFGLH
jgi:hypothetical protein